MAGSAAQRASGVLRAGADLVLPVTCGGCTRPGSRWCARCSARLADDPVLCRPRVPPGIPVWALGRYRGPHRQAILALKEHGRRDLVIPLGSSVARAMRTLARWGELPDAPRLHLVPAPTRTLSARRRGGDPVSAIATRTAQALGSRVSVAPMLVTAGAARDSAGLDARDRARNLRGAVQLRASARRPGPGSSVILVDDVLTTGATVAESVHVLASVGVEVAAAVVIAAA
ncbi:MULTISPECIES: ComF family protein [unclassified Gordonia (in: high G+C Gram-positive bacteria)]|uniref:ComF family protein n=1 Tax=unclassified Gordonia (in: high G+C Gram-positive bacteria) TaxID=2657482 RepID=UPI001F0FEB27|nr:phosphoribosyltransferase family protein [Gordonia sp. ABSL49_1]MCH5642244.1 ComF family protein [Gordonia sp. ABSL49_1]